MPSDRKSERRRRDAPLPRPRRAAIEVLMEISAADSIIEAEKVLWKLTIIPSRAGGIFDPTTLGTT